MGAAFPEVEAPPSAAALTAENVRLRAENEHLQVDLAAGQQREESLRAEFAALQQRLQELERQVSPNSSNSGKPPSSDGPRKPPAKRRTQVTRGDSGKRSGGQPGHKGTTLGQTADPDHIETHRPPRATSR